jgi:DNA gyrase subunit B
MADNNHLYDEHQIQVLEGLEAVRRRPACTSAPRAPGACTTWSMKWWTTASMKPWQGFCSNIDITIHPGNSVHRGG